MTKDASRSQRELLAIISTANPSDLAALADRWTHLAAQAEQAADSTLARLGQLTAEGGWTGAAATAYAARIADDLVAPLTQFAENAAHIAGELLRVRTAVAGAVGSALTHPIPWDEDTRWRVEQKKIDRSLFSYIDEALTGADEAYEKAQSNAPYQIKTGTGAVVKEIGKPTWQATVAAVGSPSVPSIYRSSHVSVGADVVRFDDLMEYQGMNTTQRAALRANAEGVNAVMATTFVAVGDGNTGGAAEKSDSTLTATPSTARTSSTLSGSGGTHASTGTVRGGAGGSGHSGGGSVGGGSPDTGGSTGGHAGGSSGTGSGGGSSSGTGSGGTAPAGSGTTGSWGIGGISAGSTTERGADGRPIGTGAAGLDPTSDLGGTGGLSTGVLAQSEQRNASTGVGGFGSGGSLAGAGSGGLGSGVSGGNASFSMGANGRGTVSTGNVGPVANAQTSVAGSGTGLVGVPARGNRPDGDEESDPEEMYLAEDRSVWADDISAPPGHIV